MLIYKMHEETYLLFLDKLRNDVCDAGETS